MTKLMAPAAAVVALGGGLAATTAAAPAAQASGPTTVAFNWWHGTRLASHYFGSIRPSVFGNSFGEPLQNLTWQSWSRAAGAHGTGLLIHMSCQPCHATVILSHAKLRPRGYGYFFNWQDVTFREFPGVSHLRWSFRAGNWVGR
ncbi:MAG TPA: hypothetical protein VHJ18_24165 [Streptosporangiaceae bacterium]|nr:hypothetical protein [Streptosporangiaceae bacterium]